MIEIWKDIKNYEGLYQISNFGRVKSLNRKVKHRINGFITIKEIIRKPVFIGRKCKKYLAVNLHKDGKRKMYKIHQLVMNTFKPNPNPKIFTEIDHIRNGNVLCNSVNDLEWVTRSENQKRAFTRDGYKGSMYGKLGKDCPTSKAVLKIDKNTKEILAEYGSMGEAERKTKIPVSNICNCCQRKKYKTAGGFIWKYKKSN